MRIESITLPFRAVSHSEEETQSVAKRFARLLSPGDVVVLSGELGAGKTTFSKGLAAHFGISEDVVLSPTFTLIRKYRGKERTVYHCDLYRLDSAEDAQEAGFFELLNDSDAVVLIEWAEIVLPFLREYFTVKLDGAEDGARLITIDLSKKGVSG